LKVLFYFQLIFKRRLSISVEGSMPQTRVETVEFAPVGMIIGEPTLGVYNMHTVVFFKLFNFFPNNDLTICYLFAIYYE
jgi:fucose 4-O-acetylase-like acetyltransferase